MHQSTDQNLNALRVFVTVAEKKSYTRAAQALGMQKSTVSRTVSDLENGLGVKLLYRSTRHIELTAQGSELFAQCYTPLAKVLECMRTAKDSSRKIEGKVRLATVHDMGIMLLSPLIKEFSECYPKVQIELLCDDSVVNLVSEAIDISVRVGRIDQISFYARKVGQITFIFVASPSFLERSSPVLSLDLLEQHQFLAYRPLVKDGYLHINREREPERIRVNPMLISGSTLAIRDMTLAGMGFSALPDFLVREHIKQGVLRQLFVGCTALSKPVHVLTQANKLLAPHIALMAEFLKNKLPEHLSEKG